MTPTNVAQMLMAKFLLGKEHSGTVDIGLDDMDNELRFQVLLSMYVECFRVYRSDSDMDVSTFIQLLKSVFNAVGYTLGMDPCTDVDTSVYYCKIKTNLSLVRSPYHPFFVKDAVEKNGHTVPPAYSRLFTHTSQLPYIFAIHETIDSSCTEKAYTVHFEKKIMV